jgi:hypothetical protein
MGEGNSTKQPLDGQQELFKAYLADLGRFGSRHENSRKFYMSVMSALFVFLSMAGKDGVFDNVRGAVLVTVALVGVLMCIAWFEHMRSFQALYAAKFATLRRLEEDLENNRALKPFTLETEALKKHDRIGQGDAAIKLGYTPLTAVGSIAPAASALLFVGLLIFKSLQ